VIARKYDERVRLYNRRGDDLTSRFPLIVEALARLRAPSCLIDGEAVACGDDGIRHLTCCGARALTGACSSMRST
jgi:ATP-dependent DNA ligase